MGGTGAGCVRGVVDSGRMRDWVCVVTDTGVADDSVAYRRAVAAATESAHGVFEATG